MFVGVVEFGPDRGALAPGVAAAAVANLYVPGQAAAREPGAWFAVEDIQ
jgi:hypothetical protein